jgi:hypothetical protein
VGAMEGASAESVVAANSLPEATDATDPNSQVSAFGANMRVTNPNAYVASLTALSVLSWIHR